MNDAFHSKDNKILSIIVPFFNEQENLPLFYSSLTKVLDKISFDWELIFVDNCSNDDSANYARSLAKAESRIKYIRFSRNFGPSVESSINAGYQFCVGDAAIVIYSDLQDPPELILEFIEKWNQGYDVVYGLQIARLGEPLWRRTSVKIFYKLLDRVSDSNPVPANAGDFRLVSRRVIDVLNQMPERSRYTRGLIAWVGFESIGVEYQRNPRLNGKSSANFFSIVTTAFTAITSFSLKPLRILTGLGISVTFLALSMAMFYAITFVFGNPVPGFTTIIIIGLFTLGLNMGALGIIGEYIGRINLETKQRPLYVIDEKID